MNKKVNSQKIKINQNQEDRDAFYQVSAALGSYKDENSVMRANG